MSDPAPSSPHAAGFQPTRWTLVLRARGESVAARTALGELCEAYYQPVFAFIRTAGHHEDAARDLTHGFFARLLAGQGLGHVDPARGRFRSFLLGAVKHYLADTRDHNRAAKRGGGQTLVSINEHAAGHTTTVPLQIADPAGPPSDAAFDREWAWTLVGRALDTLAAESSKAGSSVYFETLKPWLLGEVDSLSQADAAQHLGASEGAVKVAIHRLRKRFRELVKAEIAHTVPVDSQVQEELHYLLEVLSYA